MKITLLLSFLSSTMALKTFFSKGEEWQTGENGAEYREAKNLSPIAKEHLRRLTSNGEVDQYQEMYADGSETYYDGYAQAWRTLGWYIDCDEGCTRYLLWAAYVDEEYSGRGMSEYKFWNRKTESWDSSGCDQSGETRCVKMDCHDSSTHYSLLGFFKEPYYNDWIEDLFTYQGDCVWTDDEYVFMQNNVALPQGCTEADTDEYGNSLYYDLKPEAYGSVAIGLYTDEYCMEEYDGQYFDEIMNTVAQDRSDDLFNRTREDDPIDEWNDAFSVFSQCQPCKVYDLANSVATSYDYDEARSNPNITRTYECAYASNYENVNQCKRFAQNTIMKTADYNDIEMANNQATIAKIKLGRFSIANTIGDLGNISDSESVNFKIAVGVASFCGLLFLCALCKYKRTKDGLIIRDDPLLEPTKNGVAA